MKKQRSSNTTLIFSLILFFSFFKLSYEGLTSTQILMPRKGLEPYLIIYSNEPNLFLFITTFSILMAIIATYTFIINLKYIDFNNPISFNIQVPKKEKVFHIGMFFLITFPVTFIFLSILLG